MSFKVGEKVKVIRLMCSHGFKIDEIVTIDEVFEGDEEGEYYAINNIGERYFIIKDELRRIY